MIDKEKIESLVNKIIKNGAGYEIRRIEHAMPDEPDVLLNEFRHSEKATPFIIELMRYIIECKYLSEVFDHKLYNLGMIYVNVIPEKLIEWLVTRSKATDTKLTVDYLDKFLAQKYTPALQVVSVSGITISEEVCIGPNIKLVHIDSLMHSHQKYASAPKKIKDLPTSNLSYIADEKYPKCALIKKVKLDTVVTEKTKQSNNNDVGNYSELEEICDFLTLYKNTTALAFNRWVDIEHVVPCTNNQLKGMNGGMVEIHYKRETLISQNIWDSMLPTYKKYLNFPTQDKKIIRSALSRIKKAILRHALVDTAIDLGIGLEALFLDQNEDSQIGYKFRLRAAMILARTKEDKDAIINLFKCVYKIRSDAVHNGELKSTYKVNGRGDIGTRAIINEGIEKGIESILTIINNGHYPNWKKMKLDNT